jgi:hypothetical protein
LVKDFYAGEREGIEESDQNGDQSSDPPGGQTFTFGALFHPSPYY